MKTLKTALCLLLTVLLLPWSAALPAEALDFNFCSCGVKLEKVDVRGPVCGYGDVVMRCPKCSTMSQYIKEPEGNHTNTPLIRFAFNGKPQYLELCTVCLQESNQMTVEPVSSGLEQDGFVFDTYSFPHGAVITGWSGEGDSVVVPETLNGYPVLAIGPAAFKNLAIRDVTLPGGVLALGKRAFAGCAELEKILLPESVVAIYDEAFAGCGKLSEFTYPKNWSVAGNGVFRDCGSLARVEVAEGAYRIPAFAFQGVTALSEVVLPEGLKHIDQYAFSYTGLRELVCPQSLETLGAWAFEWCENLEQVSFNASLKVIGEFAFSSCTKLKDFTLPTKLTRIDEGSFRGCKSLEHVIIPQGVIWVCPAAFSNCYRLQTAFIPKSVKVIDSEAFSECLSLLQVHFGGTEKQWKSIRFGYSLFEEYELTLPRTGLSEQTVDFVWNCCAHVKWTKRNGETHKFSCSRCGTQGQAPHAWSAGVIGKEPTPEEAGYMQYLCILCGEERQTPIPAVDTSVEQTGAVSKNINAHLLTDGHSKPRKSGLVPAEDGFYRVEALTDTVTVEKYDRNWNLVYRTALAMELPLFGGFYLGETENYLFFGQETPDGDETTEIIRVVRYSPNWTRLDDARIYSQEYEEAVERYANVFDGTGLEATLQDGYLYLHTAVLWQHVSGREERISYTRQIRLLDMSGNHYTNGYSRHLGEDLRTTRIYSDADGMYRAELVNGNPGDVGVIWTPMKNGEQAEFQVEKQHMLSAAGIAERSVTALGTLAASESHLLVPGVGEDGKLFVAAVSKTDFTPSGTVITCLEDTGLLPSCPPWLISVGDRFLMLWTTETGIGWCFLSDEGTLQGEVYHGEGALSDCEPVVRENDVVWYVTNDSVPVFYSLDLQKPQTVTMVCKHVYRDGFCANCGLEAPEGVMGDADGSGKADYADALMILRYSIGLGDITRPDLSDMNGDGKYDYNDALTILRRSIGLE